MVKRLLVGFCLALAFGGLRAAASAPEGAIFTMLADGGRIAYDIYAFKSDIYLGGGRGHRAPLAAAGLPDGRYVFQVTDASGKTLLSTDQAKCRQFEVSGQVITGAVVAGGCEHATGIDREHGAAGGRSIQLCGGGLGAPLAPSACFKDTPIAGGEYKVWVTLEADYLEACARLGKPNGLAEIDCGTRTKFLVHGFAPSRSRVENFKIGGEPRMIATRFYGLGGTLVDAAGVTWTDTLGGSNTKYAYEDLALDVHHEARVDNVETGAHEIAIDNQPGCAIGTVYVGGKRQPKTGPQTVTVTFQSHWSDWSGTFFVDVYCR
jgi:hypothetical protein